MIKADERDSERLLLTVARLLRAYIRDGFWAHPDDIATINEALLPFESDVAPAEPLNEVAPAVSVDVLAKPKGKK